MNYPSKQIVFGKESLLKRLFIVLMLILLEMLKQFHQWLMGLQKETKICLIVIIILTLGLSNKSNSEFRLNTLSSENLEVRPIEVKNEDVEPFIESTDEVLPILDLIKRKTIPINKIVTDEKILNFLCHNQMLERAYNVQKKTGLSVATILAQKGVESAWDGSSLCKKTKNFGNIKCKCNWSSSLRAKHSNEDVCVRAWDKKERSNHYYVKLQTNFEGWKLYENLIYKRYMKAAVQEQIKDQIIWLKKKGYATDKDYVSTIWKVVKKYNFDKLQNYIDKGYTITTSGGKYVLLKQQ